MICPNCDTDNPPGMKFCQECGRPLQTTGGIQSCPGCGHKNGEGISFCEECGVKLTQAVSIPAQIKCPACNHLNRQGVQFCEECGTNFKEIRIPPSGMKMPIIKRINFRKTGAVLLALVVVSSLVFVVVDGVRYPVTKGEAKDMAGSAIQVSHPDLSDVTPQESEYKDTAGNKIVTYSYSKQVNALLEGGDIAQFTYGAIVTVNRNTGEIEVISIR